MRFYKFCLLKAYFDKGYGLTTYPKWVLATIGIGSAFQGFPISYLIFGGIIYGIACFFIGWLWYKYELVLAEAEVGNQFNLFQREVRGELLSSAQRKV